MKRNLMSIMATGLALLPFASANAFETAQGVVATPITTVPFTITASGNYYLPANITTSLATGSAITINASEVTLDLNGRSLINVSPTNQANGVFVNDQVDVTVQNGDIVGFGIGVYFSPNSADNNRKNTAANLRLDNNTIGVASVSGHSNWVKDSIIDGGSVGIFFDEENGSRAENNILEEQAAVELNRSGVALVSVGSLGVLFDNNLVAKRSAAIGQQMSGTDKYRFESFVGYTKLSPLTGGINEGAGGK
jgi:predicted RecA/RadA family phage recombinase